MKKQVKKRPIEYKNFDIRPRTDACIFMNRFEGQIEIIGITTTASLCTVFFRRLK